MMSLYYSVNAAVSINPVLSQWPQPWRRSNVSVAHFVATSADVGWAIVRRDGWPAVTGPVGVAVWRPCVKISSGAGGISNESYIEKYL